MKFLLLLVAAVIFLLQQGAEAQIAANSINTQEHQHIFDKMEDVNKELIKVDQLELEIDMLLEDMKKHVKEFPPGTLSGAATVTMSLAFIAAHFA